MTAGIKLIRGAVAATSLALLVALGPTSSATRAEDRGATATASGVAVKNGLYRGKTSQGALVTFRVKRGRVIEPAFTVYRRGCGVRLTFPGSDGINRKGRFFFGRSSSDVFTGRFLAPGRVSGTAAIDFSGSSCGGRGVLDVRFRARRSS